MDNLSYNVTRGRGFGEFLKSIFAKEEIDAPLTVDRETREYLQALSRAKLELENVEKLFNSTADPDLIEYAIYEQHAAKLKFSYLVKKAKEKNIKSANFSAIP